MNINFQITQQKIDDNGNVVSQETYSNSQSYNESSTGIYNVSTTATLPTGSINSITLMRLKTTATGMAFKTNANATAVGFTDVTIIATSTTPITAPIVTGTGIVEYELYGD